jgi:hypothetical protein
MDPNVPFFYKLLENLQSDHPDSERFIEQHLQEARAGKLSTWETILLTQIQYDQQRRIRTLMDLVLHHHQHHFLVKYVLHNQGINTFIEWKTKTNRTSHRSCNFKEGMMPNFD